MNFTFSDFYNLFTKKCFNRIINTKVNMSISFSSLVRILFCVIVGYFDLLRNSFSKNKVILSAKIEAQTKFVATIFK